MSFNLKNENCLSKNDKKWSCVAAFTKKVPLLVRGHELA